MAQKIKGRWFGDWQARKFLGGGGNGVVWFASNSNGETAAIKILTNFDGKSKSRAYGRFKNEVKVVRANSDIEGLLPIIDYYLPNEIGDDLPWYVMPMAQSLDQYMDSRNHETAIQVTMEIGRTLAALHERRVCHRDVKPANILVRDDKFYLSDFGLVGYPDKQDLTNTGERIGARWTIAPEMERNSQTADGKRADVYSLAKTLWILLTGRKDGFEGQYNPNSVNGLSRLQLTEPEDRGYFFTKAPLRYIKPLDELLHASTSDDPMQRPSMSEFVERLVSWTEVYKNFKRQNQLQWQDVQTKLFPTVLPQRAIWERIDTIAQILNYLASVDYLNHMLLPNGGGMDLVGAQLGAEPNTIELIIDDRAVYIVKPERLIFESFDFDWEWNYFLLEAGNLEETGVADIYNSRENLVEVAPLEYISRVRWEDDRDGDRKYPSDSRFVFRYIKGNFLIVQKTSLYNRSAYTYDARHNEMGTDGFRKYISEKVQLVQQILLDKQAFKIALDRGIQVNELVFAYLNQVFRKEYLESNSKKVGYKSQSYQRDNAQ